MILLQIDPVSNDEPKIVHEGCYETKNTFIIAWSLVFSIRHYRWLCDPICQLLLNNKAYYLIRTIRRILNFLQLWTIIVA
jgi:hypothetical protein